MGKHPCEIFKNIYFKEHLRATASELTSRSIVCNNTSGFQIRAFKKIGAYAVCIFNPYTFLWK